MTYSETAALHEKLDDMTQRIAEMSEKLSVHIAKEELSYQEINTKLSDHLQEHKDSDTMWRRGAVGVVFTVVGSIIVWVLKIVWTHKGV